MNKLYHSVLATIVKIIVTFVLLYHVANAKRLQSIGTVHGAKAVACSPKLFNHREILNVNRKGRGKVDCVRQCALKSECVLVAYMEFYNGTATCTKLTKIRSELHVQYVIPSLKSCVALHVSPCLNDGELFEGVCVCQKGFTGQNCEYSNPSFCNVVWIKCASSTQSTFSIFDANVTKEFKRTNPKVSFKNETLNVISVMKGMDADRYTTSYNEEYWYLETFPFFEKVAWNKFAPNPQRQIMHFKFPGEFQILSYNGTSKSSSLFNNQIEFTFLVPLQTRFATVRNMPNDLSLLEDDLSNGFEMLGTTWVYQDDVRQIIMAQLADRYWSMYVGGHFFQPPTLYNYNHIIGYNASKAKTYVGTGIIEEIITVPAKTVVNINPCWVGMNDDKYVGNASPDGWKMLGTYLKLGKDVRLRFGSSFYTVLEVIQIGDSFTFILAPRLSQNAMSPVTRMLHGVRSLITSDAIIQKCEHPIEGEEVIQQNYYLTLYTIFWFVDTRAWNKALTVCSNTSVLYGSVANLVSGVINGHDVRIWIQWLDSGVSRFLDTHMSSVTKDEKVSTESIVTWRTTIGTSVLLSSSCDLQYILVTSDGHVEILNFNIWTPGQTEVQNDVMITWFLA